MAHTDDSVEVRAMSVGPTLKITHTTKTGREWLLVESSKLQDRRQQNCVICDITVESTE